MSYDFTTPEGRYAAIEDLGPDRYNEEHRKFLDSTVTQTVAGHKIRPVLSRFGQIWMVGDTGVGYSDEQTAVRMALASPVPMHEREGREIG